MGKLFYKYLTLSVTKNVLHDSFRLRKTIDIEHQKASEKKGNPHWLGSQLFLDVS